MTPTRIVSTIFQEREKCRLRHSIGKASGPSVKKSMTSTPQALSERGRRWPRREGDSATGSPGRTMASVVAALEALNLVSGAPHPTDGRQTLLSLTDSCRQRLQVGRAARQDWLTRIIQARFSPQEQAELSASVALFKRLADD